MKDFPVFTTENGAASLILKEVPYRKTAYIRIHASLNPEALLQDCVDFCRICGAEHIYAAGENLEKYPLYTTVLEMRGMISIDEEKIENIFPVTEANVTQWRNICNERMTEVPNASTLETRDEKTILASGGAYFIHRQGKLLGIGWLEDGTLKAIASVVPGMGERVAHTLLSVCPGESTRLEVASTNDKAVALYTRLGFLPVREISRWHDVSMETLSRKNT